MKKSINIIMDDRERSGAVFKKLTAMDEVVVNTRRLTVGDYQVDGRLLFERKTLKDFALSVIDGRLFRQVTRLAASRLRGALILEGSSRDIGMTGVRREALQGALIYTSLILGVPVLRSLDPGETARLLIYTAHQTRHLIEGGIARPGHRPVGKRKRQLYILQGLPRVGPKRAAQLLNRFGNVRNVLNAGLEELTSVDGIGNDTAQRIRWAVSEPRASYGAGEGLISEI